MASSGGGQASPPYRPYRHLRILPGHKSAMSCVKFSSDGRLLASASARQDRHPLVRLLPTLTILRRLFGHSEGIYNLAWSSDDRTFHIWDAGSPVGDCVKTLRSHSDCIFCVNFNPIIECIIEFSQSFAY